MTFAIGVIVGLLLPVAWRLARDVVEARRVDQVDVLSAERIRMFIQERAR